MDSSFEIQCPPFDLELSRWDTVFPHWGRSFPPSHARRIHCFSLGRNADKESLVGHLHVAFHHTVQRVPFLAGSIVPSLEGGNHQRKVVPQGVARLDIRDLSHKLSFDRLAEEGFSQHLLAEVLCSTEDNTPHVCLFEANFIDRGLLLVVSISHIVADGRGVTEMIKIFAQNLCKAQAGLIGYPLETTQEVYRSDRRRIVTGNGVPGPVEAHPALTSAAAGTHSRLADVGTCCRTYRIGADALVALKKAASSAANNSWISTNDAISAFIWRSIMVARHRAGFLDAGNEVHVAQPVDCRALLGLEEPYFGNAIYMTQGSLPFADLADAATGLSAAARIIRAQIRTATAERFRDVVGCSERAEQEPHTRMKIADDVLAGGIILTSHFKFGLHQVDFGPAFEGRQVKALRFPVRGTMVGAVIVLPRLPDGSCEFMITEQGRTVECLVDDVFCRFTAETKTAKSVLPPSPTSPSRNGQAEFVFPESTSVKESTALNMTTLQAPHTGTIKIIEMNRPKAKNAISLQMLRQLHDEVERIHGENTTGGTRVLILASALDDVFCAGADLKQRSVMSDAQVEEFLALLRETTCKLAQLPIPTIAAVAGAALGGGLELALCCHLRVFSSTAVVGLPETKLGIIPGAGGTYRLPRIVGISHARDVILTGRRVEAQEAFAMGLCNRLVSHDSSGTERGRALQAAIELATDICGGAPLAIRAAVGALSLASPAGEEAAYASLLHTTDRLEGLSSFGEKRAAVFVGE